MKKTMLGIQYLLKKEVVLARKTYTFFQNLSIKKTVEDMRCFKKTAPARKKSPVRWASGFGVFCKVK